MFVRSAEKLERHGRRTFDGIHIATGIAKSTFARERNHFEFTTMITRKKSISKFVVSTMKHFVYIIKNGRSNRNAAVNNIVKMITEDLLDNTHT